MVYGNQQSIGLRTISRSLHSADTPDRRHQGQTRIQRQTARSRSGQRDVSHRSKGSGDRSSTITHTGVIALVPHRTALHHEEESHTRQYNELHGGHVPHSFRRQVIINDEIRIVRKDGSRRNLQDSTTLETHLPFRTPNLQPTSKRGRNPEQLNVVPSRQNSSIVSTHTLFEVDMANPMLPVRKEIDMNLGTDKPDQVS